MVSLQRRQVIIGGLATAVLPAVGWSFETPGKMVLSGRILRPDGSPLPGATVAVGRDSATTDADGRFMLATAKEGRCGVSFGGRSQHGVISRARPDADGIWRASFGLTFT
jgi:hypothetical protein